MMPLTRLIPALCLLPGLAAANPTDEVTVQPSKASVFLNTMTLTLTPLKHAGTRFESNYTAKFFPLVFMGEEGKFSLEAPDADLAKLARGETITLNGEAENTAHEKKKIIGRITPKDAATGAIHVQVYLSEGSPVPFDTTYRLTGAPTAPVPPAKPESQAKPDPQPKSGGG